MTMRVTRFFRTDRGRLAYTDSDVGEPTVILMHGLPTAKEIFDPVITRLPPRFRVIAFDLHDYGESDKLHTPMTHVERAAALDALRAHLGVERFVLVAHDLGASVAVDFMGRFGDRVSRLVLMSPPVYPDFNEPKIVDLMRVRGLGSGLLRLAKDALVDGAILYGMAHRDRYTRDIARAIKRAYDGPEGRAALLRNLSWGTPEVTFARYPEILRAIKAPTLILQGARDPYIPRAHAERLALDIRGARLSIIEDGSHFLPMDTPSRIAEEIERFSS
jgi:2-hydroxymuconate-semialdehyde hydrolase